MPVLHIIGGRTGAVIRATKRKQMKNSLRCYNNRRVWYFAKKCPAPPKAYIYVAHIAIASSDITSNDEKEEVVKEAKERLQNMVDSLDMDKAESV